MKTLNNWICGASATVLILIVMGVQQNADDAVDANEKVQVAARAVQWRDLEQAAAGLGDFDRTAKK